MLINTYTHSLDAKGRVFMPAKFREELGEKIIISRGIGGCLFVFSEEGWLDFAGKLRQIPMTDAKAQGFLRVLFASACECEPDKQGRVLLPQRLREFAGMTNEVVANGAMTRVELWSKEGWDAYLDSASLGYDEALEKLAEFGI